MSERGFAKLVKTNPEKQRAIAKRGGVACHRAGTGHEWTIEEARAAGAKGGRLGGLARQRKAREQEERGY